MFSSTISYYSYFTRPLLHAVYNTWLTPVTACGSQSTTCGIEIDETGAAFDWCWLIFSAKIFVLRIDNVFFNKNYLFQIQWNKMNSKYKTMHILLTNVHLDCRGVGVGRVPVTGMLAGMNLSKPGMNLSKPGMNLSKPGKKHNNHVIIRNWA